MSKVHKLLNQINISGRIAADLANKKSQLLTLEGWVQLSAIWVIAQGSALFF